MVFLYAGRFCPKALGCRLAAPALCLKIGPGNGLRLSRQAVWISRPRPLSLHGGLLTSEPAALLSKRRSIASERGLPAATDRCMIRARSGAKQFGFDDDPEGRFDGSLVGGEGWSVSAVSRALGSEIGAGPASKVLERNSGTELSRSSHLPAVCPFRPGPRSLSM